MDTTTAGHDDGCDARATEPDRGRDDFTATSDGLGDAGQCQNEQGNPIPCEGDPRSRPATPKDEPADEPADEPKDEPKDEPSDNPPPVSDAPDPGGGLQRRLGQDRGRVERLRR